MLVGLNASSRSFICFDDCVVALYLDLDDWSPRSLPRATDKFGLLLIMTFAEDLRALPELPN